MHFYVFKRRRFMQISDKKIAALLAEKGMIDFLPFILKNSQIKVWGYLTELDKGKKKFNFCNEELEPLSREKLDINDGPLFILCDRKSYSIHKEGVQVKGHNRARIDRDADNCLLLDNDDIVVKCHMIDGHIQLSNTYILLSPSLIDLSRHNPIWDTKSSNGNCLVYNAIMNTVYDISEEIEDKSEYDKFTNKTVYTYNQTTYHGSVNAWHVLYQRGRGYFVIDKDDNIIFEHLDAIWIQNDETFAFVKIMYEQARRKVSFTNPLSGNIKEISLYVGYEKEYNDFIILKADNNAFAIQFCHYDYGQGTNSRDDWPEENHLIIANRYGQEIFADQIESDNKLKSIEKGTLTFEHKQSKPGSYGILSDYSQYVTDFNYVKITDLNSKKTHEIISRGTANICANKDNINDWNYTLYGVFRIPDRSLLVPVRYEHIDLIEDKDGVYSIVQDKFTINGIETVWQGLYKNENLLLPVNKTEIRLIGEYNGSKLIIWKENEHFGLLYDNEILLEPMYDHISFKEEYLILLKNSYSGIYLFKKTYMSPIEYSEISYVADNVFVADNKIYAVKERILNLLHNPGEDYKLIDSQSSFFIYKDLYCKDDYNPESYECYYLNQKMEICECEVYKQLGRSINGSRLQDGDYLVCKTIERFWPIIYVIEKEHLAEVSDLVKSSHDEYYDSEPYDYYDDTDYERDTYYALGGDDYDSFRENGGSIDNMMDGMGF